MGNITSTYTGQELANLQEFNNDIINIDEIDTSQFSNVRYKLEEVDYPGAFALKYRAIRID